MKEAWYFSTGIHKIQLHYGSEVDSASTKNEYQKYSRG
jgi:hypothetical protein